MLASWDAEDGSPSTSHLSHGKLIVEAVSHGKLIVEAVPNGKLVSEGSAAQRQIVDCYASAALYIGHGTQNCRG